MCKYYYINEKHIFLFVDHRDALLCWKKAIDKKWISRENLLLHIDKHADLSMEDIIKSDSINLYNLSDEELNNFRNTKLDNTMFIFAGILSKTIKTVVSFHREDDGFDFEWVKINDNIKYFEYEESLIYSLNLKYFNEINLNLNKNITKLKYIYDNKDIILDIDLDYFTQGFPQEVRSLDKNDIDDIFSNNNFKDIYNKSKIITIALEPLFCGGDDDCLYIFKRIIKFIGKTKYDLLKDAKELLKNYVIPK